MYRQIHTSFWNDPKVRKLPPEAKLLFLYLVTNPHAHQAGIYYLPAITVEHETGLPLKRLDALYHALSMGHLVLKDDENEVVWVRQMYRYQRSSSKNDVGVAKHLKTLHNSRLIKEFLQFYAEWKIPYRYPIPCPMPWGIDGASSQEQEQEQEQDKEQEQKQEQKQDTPRKRGNVSTAPPTVDDVKQFINEHRYNVDAAQFVAYYEARGWQFKTGQPMKDWRATVRTWDRHAAERSATTGAGAIDPYGNQAMVARMTAKITAESRQTELALEQPEMSRNDDK